MAKKKKKGRPEKIPVKTSKPHRRKAHHVRGYDMNRSKPYRNQAHKRNPRRTNKEIAKKGTRKQERKKKKRPGPKKKKSP